MNSGPRLEDISFDLYERYSLLEKIAPLFRPESSPYRVLDVGGHTEAFWSEFTSLAGAFIPGASVTVVDMLPRAELRNYVRASGDRLPFRDGAFDLVCSLDTLEHIPSDRRPAFLSELQRVTRDGLYLIFPFDSITNRWAESVIAEYASVVLHDPIPALMEHRQFGLPDSEEVARILSASSYPWVGFAQGNTDVWMSMMLTYHSLRFPGTDFVVELNRRFNQAWAALDWAEPLYRAGYLLSKHRSHADLEAVRATFGGAGKKAELSGVLALCQLFLTIAQNARVTVDKERHIRNIEQDLSEAREYRTKWQEMAMALRSLESGDYSTPADETPADWPRERIAALVHDVKKKQKLAADHEFQARFERRMRDLEMGLASNRRSIKAIYDSRIWKALCAAGGWLQRFTSREETPANWQPREAAPPPDGTPNDIAAFVCDNPCDGSIAYARQLVEIRGWALSVSGIDRILIGVNDHAFSSASIGLPRPDVAKSHPGKKGAGESGYRFLWDPQDLPDGPCTLRLTAISKSGSSREIALQLTIDSKEPPGYGLWIERHEPDAATLDRMRIESAGFVPAPRVSIAVPVYKTPLSLLKRCIDSVVLQTYPHWELSIADDGSDDAALTAHLQERAKKDPRIRVTTLGGNSGISAATNAALQQTTGDYVAFLDHDDELAPFALSAVVQAIGEHPDIELFYSDEDKIDEEGHRYDPFFKPEWSPELFHSCNYICHFVVMKRSLLARVGGLDPAYNGAQDYEFLLRATEQTRKISRIPRILYHWRAAAGSTARDVAEKPQACADGRRALRAHLERTAPGAQVDEIGSCRYRVRYPLSDGRVSILIPTGGNKSLYHALDEVLEKTAYKNYEVVLIDNSRASRVEEYASRLAKRKAPVRHFDWRGKPFNFSQMNNAAARVAASPYLLFLNDDTSIITAEWLGAMLEHAQRPEIGAVGALLWFPNNIIQHAGVVMGLYGNCSHAFKGLPADMPHYFDLSDIVRNCSAVTGACLMVARDKFFEAGAFDEVNLAVAFQDVDLCLKLLELGYRNVYTPHAKLYHHESASKTDRDKIPDPAEDAFMKTKWARYIADDPYYNPNLTRWKEDFSLEMS